MKKVCRRVASRASPKGRAKRRRLASTAIPANVTDGDDYVHSWDTPATVTIDGLSAGRAIITALCQKYGR